MKEIGAAEFPEPIKFVYSFRNYDGYFNLSEKYLDETSLDELKKQYQKNKEHVQEVIKAREINDEIRMPGHITATLEKTVESDREVTK